MPSIARPRPGFTLEQLLGSPHAWSEEPPFPAGPAGQHFCCVCDGNARLVTVTQAVESLIIQAASRATWLDRDVFGYQIPDPSVRDAAIRGCLCQDVRILHAWEAGEDARNTVLGIVDCRAMLQGWSVVATVGGRVRHADLVAEIGHFTPDGWQVQLDDITMDGEWIQIFPGGVIVASFVPLSSEEELGSPTQRNHPRAFEVPAGAPDVALSTSYASPTRAASDNDSIRSRSPRHGTRDHRVLLRTFTSAGCLFGAVAVQCVEPAQGVPLPSGGLTGDGHLTWFLVAGFLVLCSALGIAWRASWLPGAVFRQRPVMCWNALRRCKLLTEPKVSSMLEQAVFDELRHLADSIGLPWPYLRSVFVHGFPGDSAELATRAAADSPTEMPCAILVPDFRPERVTVHDVLPIDTDRLLSLVQAQREPLQVERFPFLVAVVPQPQPQWGLFVAAPVWAPRHPLVVFDLLALDGRIFTLHVPLVAPVHFLLRLARVPPGVAVNVVVGFEVAPAPLDRELRLLQGQCITFTPAHLLPPPVSTIDTMLLSATGWGQGAAFHGVRDVVGYCLATEGNSLRFVPDPGRPWAFRRDLARECHMPEDACVVVPSQPAVLDCQINGVACRTVLSVIRRRPALGQDWMPVAVDCRAIMQGWTVCIARQGLVRIAELEQELGEFAPLFWKLEVVGPRPDSGVRPVVQGEVLVVVYVPDLDDAHGDHPVGTAVPDATPPPDEIEAPLHDIPRRDHSVVQQRGAASNGPARGIDRTASVRDVTHRADAVLDSGVACCTFSWIDVLQRVSRVVKWQQAGCICLVFTSILLRVCGTSVSNPIVCAFLLQILFLSGSPDGRALIPRLVMGSHRWIVLILLISVYVLPGAEAASHTAAHRTGGLAPEDIAAALACSVARPIATPCRGRDRRASVRPLPRSLRLARGVSTPYTASCADLGVPEIGAQPTLLEESVRLSQGRPFYLAATLLDVLLEDETAKRMQGATSLTMHDGVARGDVASAGGGVAALARAEPSAATDTFTLCLDDALPRTPCSTPCSTEHFNLDCGQCALPFDPALLDVLRSGFAFSQLGRVPARVPKPGRFDTWIREGLPGSSPEPASDLVITTDGAYLPHSGQAGWAVVVSARSRGAPLPGRFLGCFFGPFLPVGLCAECGVAPANAYLAETVGLLWAAVLGFKLHHCGRILFRADCQSAIEGVSGSVNTAPDPICIASRSFHLALRALRGDVAEYAHVRGHDGDPANELADGLAGIGALGRCNAQALAFDIAPWLRQGASAAKWLPHACLSLAQADTLPALQSGVFSWSLQQPASRIDPSLMMRPFARTLLATSAASDKARATRTFSWTMASFNALSLQDAKDPGVGIGSGLYGAAGRIGLLDGTLNEKGIFLLGVQEARTPTGSATSEHYQRYCSGCTSEGQFGIELWIASGGDWPSHRVVVVHACPTRLIARLSLLGQQYMVAVCHAPHRSHDEKHKQQWWEATITVCRSAGAGLSWLLLFDANCRLGDVVSDHEILTCAPRVGWHVNINDHAAVLNEYLFSEFARDFPLRARRMRASFISEDTAALHATLANLRHAVRNRMVALDNARLRCAFLAWRPDQPSFDQLFSGAWLQQLFGVIEALAARIREVGKELRKRCRQDKRAYLEQLADGVEIALPGDAQTAQNPVHESLRCAELPDLGQLRDVFRSVSPMKATGPDGLPPVMCRHFSTPLSLLFWPVLMKMLCFGSEPAGYKGGTLYHIAKPGAAIKGVCDAERGILVQHTLEKVMHKALRPLSSQLLEQRAAPLQLGGRKGLSHAMGFYCSRLFMDAMRAQSRSSAILFCDLAAAYYAVVRETLLGCGAHQASISDIAASLHLSDDDLQALQFYTSEEPVLSGPDGSDLLRSIARELHSQTWFVMHQDSQMIMTRRGTRPGSSWADSLFSLLFVRVLHRRGNFQDAGLQPRLTWSGRREPFPSRAGTCSAPSIAIQDIIFADDLATCVWAERAAALPGAVRHVAGCSIDTLRNHALRPNIAPKKTAALLAPVGGGAKAMREATFTVGRGKLTVLCETSGPVIMDAVASYRHLGSVLMHNGSLTAEARARVQCGWQLFREGKTHCAGAWPFFCKTGWRVLESCYFCMLRSMIRIPRDADQHWSEARVLAEVGLPCLRGLIAVERLRFLAQLWRSGPDEAFALIQHSSRAIAAFEDAATWMLEAVSATTCLGPLRDNWDSWTSLFGAPGRLKGILRRASAWHVARLRARAAFEKFCVRTWAPLPPPPVALETADNACLVCGIAFFDEHAWSAHAVRAHGFRSRARRFAVGIRCRACGTGFIDVKRHRWHLKTSVRCCQAVEWNFAGLLEPDLSSPRHAQSVRSEGFGVDHLPAIRPVIAVALLERLRIARPQSDTEIFEIVRETIEPFQVLRNTLQWWINELPCSALREQAEDVLLCMQVDLHCDLASRMPRDRSSVPVSFAPQLTPFGPLRCCRSGQLVFVGTSELPAGNAFSHPNLVRRFLDFSDAHPDLDGIAALVLVVPPAPVPLRLLWEPASCTLRALRAYLPWLSSLLSWTSALIALASLGRPCSVTFSCPREVAGSLTEWLDLSCRLSPGVVSLLAGFT
ncbi:unnamed protein product [Symbiodinium sp. CCMP2592]|nr:unnamed protein product [Symbiodinium sp. CCMP2592]